jgi:hypothetical protein
VVIRSTFFGGGSRLPADLPANVASNLKEIASLPDEIFDQLLAGLRALPTEIKQYRVFSETDFAIRDLPDNGESVKSAAFSLLLSRARSRSPIDQFVTELGQTISSVPGFDPALVNRLKARATTILSIRALDLVAKAHDVLLEHANAFSTSRVISDVRPVFGEDVGAQPMGAVLVHMLSIVYRNAGKRENFVVALDEKDIDRLLEVLERAKIKQQTLRDTLNTANVPYVKVV